AEEAAKLPANARIYADFNAGFMGLFNSVKPLPSNATTDWLESEADYAILSLYGDIYENSEVTSSGIESSKKIIGFYHPKLGPFDADFMKSDRPKLILDWWPDYSFSSPKYLQWLAKYPRASEVKKGNQTVFVVLKIGK
ncbi:MAG: hypothetical protein ACP5IG_04855, partial [Candidatus Micrarchaeia archaeon]